MTPVLGRRIAYFTTAPADAHAAIERHLREELGAEVVLVSGNLARRDALREDLARAREAEVYLVEIKAAAIDVVAEAALERGVEVVFADNELVPVGVLDLDSELIRLADQAIAREAVRVTDRRHRRPLPLGGEDGLPFSKGLLARTLTGTGISTDRAYELALAAEADITQSGRESISFERLGELARETLGEEDGATTMRRLRRFQDLYDLDLPVIVLVGGATGTGKSTVATDVAYRLGITRVTSTDFVRQTMRAFFSQEFMPAIHHSSFEAGRATADEDAEGSEAVLDGFLEQTRDVLVGVQAAIDRALEEGWSMVLEGVHLVPGMLPREIEGALVVQCVLAINDAEAHASHFWIRDTDSEGVRPYEKYLDAFDDIRLVQAYILGRARKHEVPVIENGNIEDAIGDVMELVLSATEPVEARQ